MGSLVSRLDRGARQPWKSVRLLLRRGLTGLAVRCYVGSVRVRSLNDPADKADAERLL
jgi:hypothetical protein